MKKPMARLRISLWLETDETTVFGMGRWMLLRQVDERGSLKKAAQTMNMSYRAAWGKMKQTEKALGQPLIEKHGSNRTGFKLTQAGREIMSEYAAWLEEVENYAAERAAVTMNWAVQKYSGKSRP